MIEFGKDDGHNDMYSDNRIVMIPISIVLITFFIFNCTKKKNGDDEVDDDFQVRKHTLPMQVNPLTEFTRPTISISNHQQSQDYRASIAEGQDYRVSTAEGEDYRLSTAEDSNSTTQHDYRLNSGANSSSQPLPPPIHSRGTIEPIDDGHDYRLNSGAANRTANREFEDDGIDGHDYRLNSGAKPDSVGQSPPPIVQRGDQIVEEEELPPTPSKNLIPEQTQSATTTQVQPRASSFEAQDYRVSCHIESINFNPPPTVQTRQESNGDVRLSKNGEYLEDGDDNDDYEIVMKQNTNYAAEDAIASNHQPSYDQPDPILHAESEYSEPDKLHTYVNRKDKATVRRPNNDSDTDIPTESSGDYEVVKDAMPPITTRKNPYVNDIMDTQRNFNELAESSDDKQKVRADFWQQRQDRIQSGEELSAGEYINTSGDVVTSEQPIDKNATYMPYSPKVDTSVPSVVFDDSEYSDPFEPTKDVANTTPTKPFDDDYIDGADYEMTEPPGNKNNHNAKPAAKPDYESPESMNVPNVIYSVTEQTSNTIVTAQTEMYALVPDQNSGREVPRPQIRQTSAPTLNANSPQHVTELYAPIDTDSPSASLQQPNPYVVEEEDGFGFEQSRRESNVSSASSVDLGNPCYESTTSVQGARPPVYKLLLSQQRSVDELAPEPEVQSNPLDSLLIHDVDRSGAETLLRSEITTPNTIGYVLRRKEKALVLSMIVCYPRDEDAGSSLYLGHHFNHDIILALEGNDLFAFKGGAADSLDNVVHAMVSRAVEYSGASSSVPVLRTGTSMTPRPKSIVAAPPPRVPKR